MRTPPSPHDVDQRFERFLGACLRIGVISAAVVVLAGGVLYLVHHAAEPANFHVFHEGPGVLDTPGGIVEDATTLRGRAIIQLGILLLIATPVTRVVLSVLGFARQRDWTYVVLTLIVLAVLLYSLVFEGL